jgi:hypothetical protein
LAVGRALPGVPHQLCQFHDLREAVQPVFEADRHAKKELNTPPTILPSIPSSCPPSSSADACTPVL